MQKNIRATLGAIGAIVLATTLGACAPNESVTKESAAGDKNITIKYSAPVPGALPFLPVDIAIQEGFFKDEGIEVVVTQTSAQALPAALSGGQIQMTGDTAYNIARYLESGVEMRFVSGLNNNVDFTLLAAEGVELPASDSPGSWKATFGALRGKSIGTAGKAGPIGLTVRQLMTEAGVPENEYSLIDTPGAAAGNALAAGQIDAVVSGGGFDAPLVENGLAHRVLTFGTDIPEIFGKQVNAALSMSQRFIEDNPEAPARVQRAIEKSVAYIQDPANIDQVVKHAIAAGTPETSELASKISSYDYSAVLSKDGLQAAFEWAKAAGISSKVIDVSGAIAKGVEAK